MQSFVEHMREGVKPLRTLCARSSPTMHQVSKTEEDYLPTAKVFISYQWDVQDKVRNFVSVSFVFVQLDF